MEFIEPAISAYAEKHTTPESSVLQELNRETHARVLMPRMLSGHLQGRVLSMFSHMIRPKLILEIGTYTGYSAICLAEGLIPEGHLHTIDINDELQLLVKSYISKAGLEKKITTHYGNAVNLIPALQGPFDLVFIDADKINYSNYYKLVFDKVNSGGYIIADNVLWSGKILEDTGKTDKDTRALQDFNEMIRNDKRVEKVLFPIRDGLMVVRKVSA
jgi:predicted O-methyltransferase YrrM